MFKYYELFTLCLLWTLPLLTAGQDTVGGYAYAGAGECADSALQLFDGVYAKSTTNTYTALECKQKCVEVDNSLSKVHTSFYVGVATNGVAVCGCHYENGQITAQCNDSVNAGSCATAVPGVSDIYFAGENSVGGSNGSGCTGFWVAQAGFTTQACYTKNACAAAAGVCFSSHALAEVKNEGSTRMDKIRVGDQVLTGSGDYRTVYTIDHHHASKKTTFLQVSCQRTTEPLELTPLHMVYLDGHLNPVPASTLDVGDKFKMQDGPCTIDKISTITRNGLFSPITTDGTIVVNGVIASTYSAYFNENGYIDIGGYNLMSHQTFFDKALKPYKLMCSGLSLESCKTTNEKVAISELAWSIFEHWKGQNKIYQMTFFVILLPFLHMIDSVLTWYKFFVASLFVFVVWHKKMKTNKMKM